MRRAVLGTVAQGLHALPPARQPRAHARHPAQHMKDEEAAQRRPSVPQRQRVPAHGLAVGFQCREPRGHFGIERPADHDHVGFHVERQAQRVEVARADGGPAVVHDRDLAVHRAGAVFMHLDARAQQVAVEQARGKAHRFHVGHALQEQLDLHAAPGRAAQVAKEPVARKEVGIGDAHARACGANGLPVDLLDAVGRGLVVAGREQHGGGAGGRTG
ncbi:hypothetical protein D3C86_1411070 [compost metagenome]